MLKKLKSTIPPDILKRILEKDKSGIATLVRVRWYSYLEWQGKELAIASVAVKNGKKFKNKKEPCKYIKKVCVHVLNDTRAYYRDIHYIMIAGYQAEFYEEPMLDKVRTKRLVNKYGDAAWYACEPKYFRLYSYNNLINPEFLGNTEKFKYCAYDGQVDILKYLAMYEKNPKVELVAKLMGTRFAASKMIVSKVNKDKNFVFWLRDHKQEIEHETIPVVLKAYNDKISIKDANKEIDLMNWFKQEVRYSYSRNKQALSKFYSSSDKGQKAKIIRYLKYNDISPDHYADYLNALKELNIDMSDTKNIFPKDFKYWSEVRINQFATLQAQRDASKYRELSKKMLAVAQKYAALTIEGEQFVVLIADSKPALIKEGTALHHCVGKMDYDQRIIKEQSLIFFIRRAENKDKPFVTVEFSIPEKRILQCYGVRDSKPDKEVLDFVGAWAKKAKRRLQNIQRKVA